MPCLINRNFKNDFPEKGQRIQQPKHCITNNNHKDEDNSPKNNTKYYTLSLISKIQSDKMSLY